MFGFLFLAVLAALTGRLVRRLQRRRAAAGSPTGVPCMARRPAGRGRWRAGRVEVDQGAARLTWRGPAVDLTGARATAVRPPSVREGLSINPGSRIVTCALPAGPAIEIAVMSPHLGELLAAVPEAPVETTP